MAFLVGDTVVNKRNGHLATVVQTVFDGSIHVRFEGSEDLVQLGKATVKRWYRRFEVAEKDVKVRRDSTLPPLPKGEKGVGFKLRVQFEIMLKANVPKGDVLEQKYNPKSSMWVYKLNGKNIFECTESKYRFSVLVSPKNMSAHLLASAYTTYPKERHWALATRFIFVDVDQKPLMKQVVLAGIYSNTTRK